MIRNIRRCRGFVTGLLVTSLLWLLGLMYITCTTTSAQTSYRTDIGHWAANRRLSRSHQRNNHTFQQNGLASVVNTSDTAKLQQRKGVLNLKNTAFKRMQSANFSAKFGAITKHAPSSKSTQKVSIINKATRTPLFISDQPVVVKNINFWMQAVKTGSDDEKQRSDEGFSRHAFNQYASDKIGYFREIPDTRHKLCHSLQYSPVTQLPNTSIIICFHNEAKSALLRTVHSIIQRSPSELIHEILLVDDASTFDDLKAPLDQYVADHLPIVTVVRATHREGLIRARLLGAHHATGEVLTFLDSHCEVNHGWLTPLLSRLKHKPNEAAVPVIDVINQRTLAYTWVGLNKGGFDWSLSFKWHSLKEHKWNDDHRKVQPFRSPAMPGGLFSIYREYFFAIGSYDEGMDIWGGENIEISLRLWMCGGGIEIIPCSRVGHIFRSGRPYSSPGGDTAGPNAVRVLEVWLDEYKEMVYKKIPLFRTYKHSDVSSRLLLRKQLQCRTFKWYLENIYPELISSENKLQTTSPVDVNSSISKNSFTHRGLLRNARSGLCIGIGTELHVGKHSIAMIDCNYDDKDQVWSYMESKQIMHHNWCLQPLTTDSSIIVASACEDTITRDSDKTLYPQLWLFEETQAVGKLLHAISGKCLHGGDDAVLDSCSNESSDSKWSFTSL